MATEHLIPRAPISIRIDRCDLYLDEYQRGRYFKVVGVEVVVADWEIDL
jgi:hypothetical protein